MTASQTQGSRWDTAKTQIVVCQVFTTCGSAEKRQFLLNTFPGLKAENIGDSRSCSFEGVVMRATHGRGVHLILNSLADDKLQVDRPLMTWSLA